MAPTLEAIKGGGGSIRVGTTGTVGSLMTRELEFIKWAPQTPVCSREQPPTVSVSCGSTTRRLETRRASNELSSTDNTNHKNLKSTGKTRSVQKKNTNRIPMLDSDNYVVERTPNREKPQRKGPNIAEVVDITCGNPERWSSFRKLSFSKLSENAI